MTHRFISLKARSLLRNSLWLLIALNAIPDVVASPTLHPEVRIIEDGLGRAAPTVFRGGRGEGMRPGGGGAGGAIQNGDFSTGLDGWTAAESGGGASPGGVAAEGGRARLAEGDSFLITLSQTFLIPEQAATLSLEVFLEPGFDTSAESLPDAFEVSLLNGSSASVVETWDALATSCFNLQEDGTAHRGLGTSWDGTRVTIDVRGVPAGTEVTLFFDIIGADPDTAGALRVDAVSVGLGLGGIFSRGDSNGDGRLDISDPIVTLGFLFLGNATPRCFDAADADDTGRLDVTDPINTLNYLFLVGSALPPPFPACGLDPTDDPLDCAEYDCPAAGQ